MLKRLALASVVSCIGSSAWGALPPPPQNWVDWSMAAGPGVPGVVSANKLLDAPAGGTGVVTCRDGHFFVGEKRIRFWGVNFTFANAFPTHEQADATAERLSRFGINCVRLHHMDNAPFPRGIFADKKLETLSPEALDRLDYFVAALKKRGVYVNLNLHVSRWWSQAHGWPQNGELEHYDKTLDIFHPDLIAANRVYAKELLTHVNAYTHNRYADEPAVAMIEINNENSLFQGSESKLDELPEVYGAELTKQWNAWLIGKYGSREGLQKTWGQQVAPTGENLVGPLARWKTEQHGTAKVGMDTKKGAVLSVQAVDGTDWHAQFSQGGIGLHKGEHYTLTFTASADTPEQIGVSVGQAHEPWSTLAAFRPKLSANGREFTYAFTPDADEPNARVSFHLGQAVNTIRISNVELRTGGSGGLAAGEDPAKGTVARKGSGQARERDWYTLLQNTEERYFVGMMRFLKDEVGCRQPITGTIGYGALGTLTQSRMDFVDQHAYWDHPNFPHKKWDMADWIEKNQAMVDAPERATLWRLGATRIAGRPFTVTEYNHSAPNDWAAECIPMVATFAAMQDWDGIFLFDCGHADPESARIRGFFDIEGNPTKMALMPLGSRVFLSGDIRPIANELVLHPNETQVFAPTPGTYGDMWAFVHNTLGLAGTEMLANRVAVDFTHAGRGTKAADADPRVKWETKGEGTGRYLFKDPSAAAFVGFGGGGVNLGPVTVDLDSPFATLMLVPVEPGRKLAEADRLLLSAIARAQNTDMQWNAERRSVSNHWGKPPTQIEPVRGRVSGESGKTIHIYPLDAQGNRLAEVQRLEERPTIWYELVRE